jgi:hypothetical protein
LSIWIEQAFGLFVSKWCVFKKPLEVSLRCTTLLIEAAFFTPNYVANLDLLGDAGASKANAVLYMKQL